MFTMTFSTYISILCLYPNNQRKQRGKGNLFSMLAKGILIIEQQLDRVNSKTSLSFYLAGKTRYWKGGKVCQIRKRC